MAVREQETREQETRKQETGKQETRERETGRQETREPGTGRQKTEDRKRKKRKQSMGLNPLVILLPLLILGGLAYGAFRVYDFLGPNREIMTEKELFEVSGNTVAILYDYEKQETGGVYKDGEVYLPIEWVQNNLNERFYWDGKEKKLVYALPDSLVTADETSVGDSGKKLLLLQGNEVYLSEALVKNYTDVRMDVYADGDVKRIFVGNIRDSYQTVTARGNTELRSRTSVKGLVIAKLKKGTAVSFIPDHPNSTADNTSNEKWQRVVTSDGLTGYIERKRFSDPAVQQDQSTFKAPVYQNISLKEPVILAWMQVTNQDSNQNLEPYLANTRGLNVLSPTWFALKDNKGNYTSYVDQDVVRKAHEKGIQVWALVDNFSTDVSLGVLLEATAVRQKLISSLVQDIKNCGADGINIDFEAVRQDAKKQYLQFIRELSIACRKNKLVLSIDVPNPASYNLFYDREELGTVADYVINMGYDEHTPGGDEGMGSVSSLPFVKQGIESSLTEVPKEKLINGIPFYTRIWTKTGKKTTSDALGISDAQAWVKKNKVQLNWDDKLGQYYGERTSSDGKTTDYLWMEEEKSIAEKVKLIKNSGIAGVACWKLGMEPADLWDTVSTVAEAGK